MGFCLIQLTTIFMSKDHSNKYNDTNEIFEPTEQILQTLEADEAIVHQNKFNKRLKKMI